MVACGDSGSGGGGSGGNSGGNGGQGGTAGSPEAGGGGQGGSPVVPEGCTLITYAGGDKLYSANGVGFEFSPSAGSNEPEVVIVSPTEGGVTSLGLVSFASEDAPIFSGAIRDAVDLLTYEPGDMDGQILVAVAGTVTLEAAPTYPTQFKARVKGTLSKVQYRELDQNGLVIPGGECLYLEEASFDASDLDASCGTFPEADGFCMSNYVDMGHDCNPITNDGCEPNEVCDYGGNFRCYADPVTQNVCEPCDNTNKVLCKQGMTCDSDFDSVGKCFKYCCTDADCGAGGSCVSYSFATNIGVCFTAN